MIGIHTLHLNPAFPILRNERNSPEGEGGGNQMKEKEKERCLTVLEYSQTLSPAALLTRIC